MNVRLNKEVILKILVAIMLLGIFLTAMIFFLKDNLPGGIIALQIPFALLLLAAILRDARLGLASVFIMNYFALGLVRYIPAPLGLTIDLLLLITWLSLFFKAFNKRIPMEKARRDLTFLALLWYAYIFFQLLNPEAVSREAWFYAMRGVGLYKILIIPLAFIVLDHPKYMRMMINAWAVFTLLAVIKGLMQKFSGFDPYEQRWLDEGGALTHIIISGVRYFSFFSDAGNYGASMGFSGVALSIIALHTKNITLKLSYGAIAMGAFYAMLISGTRGALAVPFAGYFLYAILTKRITILIIGIFLMISLFVFLKYTSIGQGNYEIRRARTTLDPNDASFQVRRNNQRILKSYLATRPLGGGIGSAGNWGQRFTPNTFLANIPTDSWYVMIWAETGIVGLILHVSILLYIVGKGAWIIMSRLRDPGLIIPLIALLSGMFGIMVASYGNGLLGQMPNGIIIYLSMAFIFMAPQWEKQENNLVEITKT